MSGSGWRPHIESALCLDIGAMFRTGCLKPCCMTSGSWRWTCDGEQIASAGYSGTVQGTSGELRLNYTWTYDETPKEVDYVICLSSVPLHYGGRRWYAHCPYTGRRALKLYKFGSIEYFCHRTAIRPLPTYASQRVSGSDRILTKRWALRYKLGDEYSTLLDTPNKPKWMRRCTFQKYLDRDAELEARELPYLMRLLGRMKG